MYWSGKEGADGVDKDVDDTDYGYVTCTCHGGMKVVVWAEMMMVLMMMMDMMMDTSRVLVREG